MPAKHGKVVIERENLPSIYSHSPLNMCLRRSRDKLKHISTITMLKVPILIPVMYTISHFSWEVSLHTECILSPPAENPWTPNKASCRTYCERFPSLRPRDPLIMWLMRSYIAIWKIYISTITRLMASKFDRVLTDGKRLRT